MSKQSAILSGLAARGVSGTVTDPEPVTFPTSVADLRERPVVPIWSDAEPNAAGALRVGRSKAYALGKCGEIPTIRLGRRVVVPSARLLALLGIED